MLVSTVASKSILRVAAEETCARYDFVHYFPSYEIITAPGESERYFEPNLRSVNPDGVAHVMRVFDRHLFGVGVPARMATAPAPAEHRFVADIICDEEATDA